MTESWKALAGGIKENLSNVVSERNLAAIRKIGTDAVQGIRDIGEKTSEHSKVKSDVESAAADEIISFVREYFSVSINHAQTFLEKQSREFWAQKSAQLKQELTNIVTDSTALTSEKRSELTGIIIEYQDLIFENKAEVIFDKEAFRRRFLGDANKLDLEKLSKRHNREMKDQIEETYVSFERSHASLNKYLSTSRNSGPRTMAEILLYNQANPALMLKYGQDRMMLCNNETTRAQLDTRYLNTLALREREIKKMNCLFDDNGLDVILRITFSTLTPLLGFPSISIPIGQKSNSAPIGSCWIGRRFDEARMISVVSAVERILDLSLAPELDKHYPELG